MRASPMRVAPSANEPLFTGSLAGPGISLQFVLERMSTVPWNQCPLSRGNGVQVPVEYANTG
jgi:hypothetical protein